MEQDTFSKFNYSSSSFNGKLESVRFSLEDSLKKNSNEFFIKKINKIFPAINYIYGKFI
jgi:hypothetical protein